MVNFILVSPRSSLNISRKAPVSIHIAVDVAYKTDS